MLMKKVNIKKNLRVIVKLKIILITVIIMYKILLIM